MTIRLPTSEMSINDEHLEHDIGLFLDQHFCDEVIGLLEELDAERQQRERQGRGKSARVSSAKRTAAFSVTASSLDPTCYSEGMRPRVL